MAYKPNLRLLTAFIFAVTMLTSIAYPAMLQNKALAQETKLFTFAAFGDSDCQEADSEANIAEIDSRTSSTTDIVIGLGDYCYDSGSDAGFYNDDGVPINSIFRPSVGNHDESDWSAYNSKYDDYYSAIDENNGDGYYDYTHENVRFIVLNTELTLTEGSTQHNWLESALADAQLDEANNEIDWIAVYFHKVMYEQPGSSHSAESYLYNDVAEDLDNAGVDMVFNGHQHWYARTHQVSPDATSSPTVVDSDDAYVENGNAFVAATVGIGGRAAHDMQSTREAWINDSAEGVTGAVYCDVYASLIDCDTILIDNTVIDSWSIAKAAPASGHQPSDDPYGFFDGVDDYISQADASNLDLNTFTVQTDFRTATNFTQSAQMVNKGGQGVDTSGDNMNYGIWFTDGEKIQCGFETSAGTNYYATSPLSYADNEWHTATCTYGGSTVRLYIDGTQVATQSTSGATPETNAHPLALGKNARASDAYYQQDLDSVFVYNTALSATQIADAYANTASMPSGWVYTNQYPDPTP